MCHVAVMASPSVLQDETARTGAARPLKPHSPAVPPGVPPRVLGNGMATLTHVKRLKCQLEPL